MVGQRWQVFAAQTELSRDINTMGDQRTIELPAIQSELTAFYPHVWKKIMEHWGTLMCPGYLKQLMIVDGDRARAGFSRQAIAEVLHLTKLHDRQFPHHAIKIKPVKANVWTSMGSGEFD